MRVKNAVVFVVIITTHLLVFFQTSLMYRTNVPCQCWFSLIILFPEKKETLLQTSVIQPTMNASPSQWTRLERMSRNTMGILVSFLGTIAPHVGRLAEVSVRMSYHMRNQYCRHCGTIFVSDPTRRAVEIDTTTGRAKHAQKCDLSFEIDPFSFMYPYINWSVSFVGGGWATFLHFREHLRYDNPWRWGGPMVQRDLDILFDDDTRDHSDFNMTHVLRPLFSPELRSRIKKEIAHYSATSPGEFLMNKLEEHVISVESPIQNVFTVFSTSHPRERREVESGHSRFTTDSDACCKLKITPTRPGPPVMVDFLPHLRRLGSARKILETFDLPWCRVGFRMDRFVWDNSSASALFHSMAGCHASARDAATWILPDSHSNGLKLSEYVWCNDVDEFQHPFWTKQRVYERKMEQSHIQHRPVISRFSRDPVFDEKMKGDVPREVDIDIDIDTSPVRPVYGGALVIGESKDTQSTSPIRMKLPAYGRLSCVHPHAWSDEECCIKSSGSSHPAHWRDSSMFKRSKLRCAKYSDRGYGPPNQCGCDSPSAWGHE
jgi:hypothetical protein